MREKEKWMEIVKYGENALKQQPHCTYIKNKQSGKNSFPTQFQEIDMPLQFALFSFEGLFR